MNEFTLHCMDWKSVAPLVQEFRATTNYAEKISKNKSGIDDEACLHALALKKSKVVGSARITPSGQVDFMVVLPNERQRQIEDGLISLLNDYHRILISSPSSIRLNQ
jgi:hypothetical protein